MELTQGILKSIESGVVVVNTGPFYALKYNGQLFVRSGRAPLYRNQSQAKAALTKFVANCFAFGGYWDSCAEQIKKRHGYDVDFSAIIAIMDSPWRCDRLDLPETKKLIKDISDALIKAGVFTIELVE